MSNEDDIWKRRLLVFTLVRLSALILVLAGLAVAVGDFVRPGGWPVGGVFIILLGIVEMLILPRLLKKAWKQQ